MSTQKIPNTQKQIIQSNDGDYKGNLWSTFNIDLDSNPGTIKTSKRLNRVVDATLWGTDDIVQALQIHDGQYYVATNATVADCSVDQDPTDESNWGTIATLAAEDLGLETDMTSYRGLLLISLGTDIMSWDGSTKDDDWWTVTISGSALTASKTHTLEVLRTGNDTLFVTDGNLIRYYNPASGHATITLDTLMTANALTPSLDRMWVGTYTEVENNAYIYELRVGDTSALQAYEVDGRVCLTMFTYNNIPYVITERGYIQAFNGAGFATVAQFPWANESKVMDGCRPGLVQDSATGKAIHPKGAKVKGKYCYIYVDTDDEYQSNGVKLDTRSPAGVWVLDLETYSLTHRYSLTAESNEYGQHIVDRSGPLLITNTPETRLMVGGSVDSVEGIWMEGTETNQAYFTTVRHESDSVTDAFETFVVKHDTLDTDEEITVKYKDVSLPNFPLTVADITWLDATSFTTTNALTDVLAGDEVEIIAGYRAGNLANIVSIEGSTTKTVVIDQSLGVLNELSDIQIDRFKNIDMGDVEMTNEYIKVGASGDASSPSRQYKVVMTGDVKIREVISKSNSKEQL
jgi:hypothetical protein